MVMNAIVCVVLSRDRRTVIFTLSQADGKYEVEVAKLQKVEGHENTETRC